MRYYTIKEAALLLSVSVSTIRRAIRLGYLEPSKNVARPGSLRNHWRIHDADMEVWADTMRHMAFHGKKGRHIQRRLGRNDDF